MIATQLSADAEGAGATAMLKAGREVPADVLAATGVALAATGAATLNPVDLS